MQPLHRQQTNRYLQLLIQMKEPMSILLQQTLMLPALELYPQSLPLFPINQL